MTTREGGARRQTFQLHPVAGACALFILAVAAPLHAQESASQDAQAAPVPTVTGVVPAPNMATVNVSGIRRGIEAAIELKRDSTSIVEAISAEDIGKLPDTTVAQSISRLAGVTTQRSKVNGKATEVSVRGMSPTFNGSLLNGREQASTSDARSPEFDLFPSELTGSVLVYKTPDASLIGQGLASTIDLRTLRPLDFGKRMFAVNARKERIGFGSGSDLGSGHRKTLTFVDQFFDRTLGLSVGLTSFKQDNGGELKFDSWGANTADIDYNGQTVKAINGFMAETSRRKAERDGASVTLQFRPNDKFRSTADLFYSRGEEATKKTGIEGAIVGGTGIYDPDAVLTNATIENGIVTAGTFSNYKGDVRNHMFSNKDRLLSVGVNNELKVGQWRIVNDLSYSKGTKRISNFETMAGQPGNTPESDLGSITYSGFNGSNYSQVNYAPSLNYADRNVALLTDVAGWGGGPLSPQAGYLALPTIDDKVQAVRLSAERDTEWGPLAAIRFGVNYTKRDKSRLGEEGRLSVRGGDGYAAIQMPGSSVEMAGPSGIPVASFDPTGSLGTLYELNRWVDATVLARDWTVGEKVTTAYLMGELDGELLSIPYSGNIGVQVVDTRQRASGNQVDLANCTGITTDTCPAVVKTGGIDYTKVLPSLNLTFDLGNDQLLRVGAGKQVSRANLDNLKASMNFGLQSATAEDPALTGFAGNPELKPYEARALDLSYEKYFGKKGYVSAALFYKKLDNYVINAPQMFDFASFTSANTPLPTTGQYAGSTVGFLTMPQNGQGGNMRGIELSANLPFGMLVNALDGFGIQASHSHTDSSVRLPTSAFVTGSNAPVFNGAVSEIGLPGLSRNVTSMRLYYEKNGLQVSLAAYRRSSFIGQILDYRSESQFTFIKGETIADAQASYEFQDGMLKGWSVFLQGHNLTNEPFQEYTSDPSIITNSVSFGRTYSAGLNYKF
jgi:iron complex outermembrane receptor protein